MIKLYRGIGKLLKKSASTFGIRVFIKFVAPIYTIAFMVLFIDKGYDYLYKDRAHKEAKAYALAGEVVFIYKKIFLTLVYPDNLLFKPLQLAHGLMLNKIDNHIPKEDGERDIWHYKFHSFDYARTMFAPLSPEDKGIRSFTNPNTSMTKEILPLIDDIYTTMKSLHDKPIKDKEFDRFDRYLAIASMAPYYVQYHTYQVDVHTDWENPNHFSNKLEKLWKEKPYKKYKDELFMYVEILDSVREKWEEDKELEKAFEQRPHTKVALYWGVMDGCSTISLSELMFDNIYPCTSSNFLKDISYYKEFVQWAYMTPNSSYTKLPKRDKKRYDFILETNKGGLYYQAKYVCEIPLNYMSKHESSLDPKYREENMRWNENYETVKKIRKLQKELNIKGKNHGK